jgi:hypothetical protein
MSTHGRGRHGPLLAGQRRRSAVRRLHIPCWSCSPSWQEDCQTPRSNGFLCRSTAHPRGGHSGGCGSLRSDEAEYLLVSVVVPPVPLLDMVPVTGMPDTSALVPGLTKAAEAYLDRIVSVSRRRPARFCHTVLADQVHEGFLNRPTCSAPTSSPLQPMVPVASSASRSAVTEKIVSGTPCPVLVLTPQPEA